MTAAYNTSTENVLGRTGYPRERIGNSVTAEIGFYNVTPVVQASASAQASVTTATLVAATLTAPAITQYGFSQAQATALLTAQDALVTRVNSLSAQNDAFRTALVNMGIIKGSA